MTYAIYTRSHPADTGCKADREQYQRCLDFAARYRLGKSLPHYSDTLVLSANGETNGLQNLFEDIRFGQIDGVIIEDTIFFGENSTRLTQIIDSGLIRNALIIAIFMKAPETSAGGRDVIILISVIKNKIPGTQHPGVFIAYISKQPLNLHLYPVRRNLATTAYRQCQHRRCMAEIDIGNHRKFL